MVVCHNIPQVKSIISTHKSNIKSVGLVPTMGALHDGHISLLRAAKESCDIVVVSIFVNYLQFNEQADFVNYPVDLDSDIRILEDEKCDIAFIPDTAHIYSESPVLKLNFQHLEETMEGKFRPGHFSGVGIIMAKLLNILDLDTIFLGQKDLQQVAVIRKLIADLAFDSNLVVVPTFREPDGLASSSRNKRLSAEERSVASNFHKALILGRELLIAGELPLKVCKRVESFIEAIDGINLQYFEIVDSHSLRSKSAINPNDNTSLCIAGYVGEIRLLDNINLNDH